MSVEINTAKLTVKLKARSWISRSEAELLEAIETHLRNKGDVKDADRINKLKADLRIDDE